MRLSGWFLTLALIAACAAAANAADVPKISYDLRMPGALLASIARYWAGEKPKVPTDVDAAFIPSQVARELAHEGLNIKRITVHGNPSDPGFPTNYYFPDYCWRPDHDTVVVWWEATRPRGDDHLGVLIARKQAGTWKVDNLPSTAPPPATIELAVCRACLWKRKSGKPLKVYINGAREVANEIAKPSIEIVDQPTTSVDGDWLNVFFADQGDVTGGIRWIDKNDALVTFIMQSSEIYRREDYAGGDHMVTWLARCVDGRWTVADIGLPVVVEQ